MVLCFGGTYLTVLVLNEWDGRWKSGRDREGATGRWRFPAVFKSQRTHQTKIFIAPSRCEPVAVSLVVKENHLSPRQIMVLSIWMKKRKEKGRGETAQKRARMRTYVCLLSSDFVSSILLQPAMASVTWAPQKLCGGSDPPWSHS